ncbi:DNA primase [Streptomyces sp. HUCO-GS316]|uniref:DNA primase n=1 Tax=Streptomyces sp. HUCO-GS316 TaxID=2692198 RepID=UPI001369B5D0|nr:DNA primase [Streptomyces sp. HUCO-GS316]MXM67938.1 DNA primase [Streptomyces sp. HUCO-GS316]
MNRVGLGLAIGAGYLLGRTRKMKLAFAVGSLVAGKRMNLSPRMLADLAQQQLRDNPQFKEIGDQLREDLRGVGKAASGAMVERQMDALADRLHDRTAQVRDQLAGELPEAAGVGSDDTDDTEDAEDSEDSRGEEPEEDYEETEPEDEEREDDEESEDEEPEDEESRDEEREPRRRRTAKKAPSKKAGKKPAAKKAPAKKSAAKKTTAKKTAGKKTAASGAGRGSRNRPSKGGGER